MYPEDIFVTSLDDHTGLDRLLRGHDWRRHRVIAEIPSMTDATSEWDRLFDYLLASRNTKSSINDTAVRGHPHGDPTFSTGRTRLNGAFALVLLNCSRYLRMRCAIAACTPDRVTVGEVFVA